MTKRQTNLYYLFVYVTTSPVSVVYQAIDKKLLTVSDLIENIKPLFYTRMRLGEFDPPEMNPYSTIPMSVVLSAEHRELAVQAACMSFVLLKNSNGLLPITKRFTRLSVCMIEMLNDSVLNIRVTFCTME